MVVNRPGLTSSYVVYFLYKDSHPPQCKQVSRFRKRRDIRQNIITPKCTVSSLILCIAYLIYQQFFHLYMLWLINDPFPFIASHILSFAVGGAPVGDGILLFTRLQTRHVLTTQCEFSHSVHDGFGRNFSAQPSGKYCVLTAISACGTIFLFCTFFEGQSGQTTVVN